MYENTLFQKKHAHEQKISTSKFIRTNLRFFTFPCISTKKSAVRVIFKCKLYLKNSIKLKKNFLRPPRLRLFFRHPHFRKQEENKGIFLLTLEIHSFKPLRYTCDCSN